MAPLKEIFEGLGRFFGDGRESLNLLKILNQDLRAEESLRVRYQRQAQAIRSPQVAAKLRELAEGEAEHAALLIGWIRELGGEPNIVIEPSLPSVWTIGQLLVQDYEAERRLYEAYLDQAEIIEIEGLKALFQKIGQEEEGHLKELTELYVRYS